MTDAKTCRKCADTKPLSEYNRRSASPDGLQPKCRSCESTEKREWEKTRTRRPYHSRQVTLYRHGLKIADYERMFAEQGGVCAICDRPCKRFPNLSVDHCHDTGEVRGLLCDSCNRGLGNFGDDPQRLIAACEYLMNRLARRQA